MFYLPYGLNTVQSKAISGNPYKIALPFAVTSLYYLLKYTISISTCPSSNTCSLTNNLLYVSSPKDGDILIFKIAYGSDSYYSQLNFSVATGSSPTISTPSSLKSTPNQLVSITLNFNDSYYGNTDLYTHNITYASNNTDYFVLDSNVRPAVLYWNALSTAKITVNVNSIGGRNDSKSFVYIINTPPVLNTIPTLYG